MSRLKLTVIVLVLGAGLALSYFIIKNPISLFSGDAGKSANNSELFQNAETAGSLPIKWVEKIASKGNEIPSGNNKGNPGVSNKTAVGSQDSNINLTEMVGQLIFEKMKTLDQSGKSPFNGFIDPKNPQTQTMINDAISKLDSSKIFTVSIPAGDVIISGDNSNEKKSEYVQLVSEIIFKNLSGPYGRPDLALGKMLDNGDASDVEKIANTYEGIYNEISRITTPSDYKNMHKKYLFFLKKANLIYLGIANLQNDPVKAQIFFQSVPDIAKEELDIKKEYAQKAQDLNG